MDRAEHADASSSRSADRVARIEGGAGERYTVYLDDGSSFFVSRDRLEELELAVDDRVDERVIDRLTAAHAAFEATAKALDLIAVRDHSVGQLRDKLAKRGFPPEAIDAACDYGVAHGYLDDHHFAEGWIESRSRSHHEGRVKLAAGLARAGVSRSVASETLDLVLTEEYEAEAFRRAVESLDSRASNDPRRAARRLASLGFSSDRIRAHLDRR